MVEVLIAGVLLASAMAAVSRISVAALSGSATLSDRARIEAAINDNIQSLQKEDSYYTENWIRENKGEKSFEDACKKPAEALRNQLESVAPKPRIKGISRTLDTEKIPGILTVTYSFQGPEQQIEDEYRVIEMAPNFAAQCYSTQ